MNRTIKKLALFSFPLLSVALPAHATPVLLESQNSGCISFVERLSTNNCQVNRLDKEINSAEDSQSSSWEYYLNNILDRIVTAENLSNCATAHSNRLDVAAMLGARQSKSIERPLILLSESPHPNAFAYFINDTDAQTPVITLSTALLRLLANESEVAFVIAHELTHLKHDHLPPSFPLTLLTAAQREHVEEVHRGWEFTADKEALKMLATAGFETKPVISLFERLSDLNLPFEQKGLESHPSMLSRIAALKALLSPEQLIAKHSSPAQQSNL